MKEFWTDMQAGMEAFSTGGQFMALFLGSLLFLFLIKPKENRHFRNYALIFTVLACFPFTAFLLAEYRTDYYNYASLLGLLPVVTVTALGLTEGAQILTETGKKLGKRTGYAVFGGLFVLIALCGTVSVLHTDLPKSNGFDKIPAEERQVLELLSVRNETEELYVWAPDPVLTWARVYDGKLKLLYGRDLWNNALSGYTYDVYGEEQKALYDWMNINWIEVEAYSLETDLTPGEAFLLAKDCGCNLVVLTREQVRTPQVRAFLEKENVRKPMLSKVSETEAYEIFEVLR